MQWFLLQARSWRALTKRYGVLKKHLCEIGRSAEKASANFSSPRDKLFKLYRDAFKEAAEEISRRRAQDGVKTFIWNLNGGADDKWRRKGNEDARGKQINLINSQGNRFAINAINAKNHN